MSRFKIILFFIIATAVVVGIFFLQFVLSFHSVKFDLAKDISVEIYKVIDGRNEDPFQTIRSSSTLPLQNGDYCITPKDSQYDTTPICFTVKDKDTSVSANPAYSNYFLGQALIPQQAAINDLITKKYSPLINNYTLKAGTLYGKGEWYGTTLTQKVSRSHQGDVYRIILKKVDDKWTIVAYPQIALNKYDYPQIPYDVLDKVNRLAGVQGEPIPITPPRDPLLDADGD